ncbi:MAG TPA: hypothetical protein VIZ28_14520 [Chitinophagaceae bacterium]
MTSNFERRLFVFLTIAFVTATIVGTLTHECGHYFVAKYLGYNAGINYYSTWWALSTPDQVTHPSDKLWITLGGPMETMLTGTIGFALLLLFNRSFKDATKLSFGQWSLIFISLFWLRQPANFIVWIGGYLFTGKFSQRGDEIKLAHYFQLPEWTIATLTAIIGAIILIIIILKFVPAKQRLTFISSGLAGGISGYIIWLVLFGKYLIP